MRLTFKNHIIKLEGEKEICKSRNTNQTHTNSATTVARHQYTTSMLDIDIIECFLGSQVIKFPPNNIEKSDVNLRSSGSYAKLASTNPWRINSFRCLKN